MQKTVPLKMNYEFNKVYKKGKFYVGKFIILYILKNRQDNNRLGIAVSKKVGKSVMRNRIRRLIRENYRLFEEVVKSGYDCVFVARSFDSEPGFTDIKKEMKFLFKKLDILDREKLDCLKGH